MSDVMGMFLIALVVAGVAAVLFLNIFRKSALHLLLLSVHSALVGIGLLLLSYAAQGRKSCCLWVHALSCSVYF
ncbi:hypothetical protein MKY82_01115 [Paenibacillus sp. FSL W7-1279]|uniref:hypothetical protein n=1 Tax=Paenibacillus TaxID=44249 RepID=UPI001F4730B0|nr:MULTISPECIES: hypothetical protein [Paenibacillus]